MANELKLPYVRFVRRVSSASKAITQWKSTMAETFEALKIAPWREATALAADVSMPVNAPLTFAPSDAYDTYKMSSTVATTGKQICYMGMVAYRYTIPADAITDSTHPTAVTLSLGADKFNTSGLRVALYLSNTATPPTDWTICREGTQHIADETIDTVTLGILASRTLLVSGSVNAAGDYTVTFDPVISANNSYLYVIISNYDYEDSRASREYYIEGSGVLDGANVQVSFEAAVTADSPVLIGDGRFKAGGKFQTITANVTTWKQNNTKNLITMVSTLNGEEWNLATYPQNIFNAAITNTISYFDGNAETTIGVESGKVSGCVMVRGVKLLAGYPFTKFSFGESTVVDLRLKSLNLLVNVWYGKPIETTPSYLRGYGSPTSASMCNEDFWFSNSVTGVKLQWQATNNTWTESPDLTLLHGGQFLLKSGSLYTGADAFPVNIAGTGIYYMIVTVAPVTMSPASAGASTNAIFKPGEFLYLS